MTASSSAGAELRFEGLGKQYGKVAAVRPLDLVITPGSLVTLLGPSGCGKTTLLRMIAGLERPSMGKLFIGGRDVTDLSAAERNVSMVFQSYALFPHMSVLDNVSYGLVSGGMRRPQAYGRAEAALETVGLKGFGARLPSEMSGGQQQRVAVARALVLEPDVLLFDEPLSNLDARLRRQMREEIRALQLKLGVTVVYVTHDQSEALAVSDMIVVMRNAEIAQAGTPRQLYQNPDNVFVATFMGEANHVRGRIESIAADSARLQLGAATLTLPHRGLGVGDVDVVIRPEAIQINQGAPGEGEISGVVASSTYMGANAEYLIDTSIGRLFVINPDVAHIQPKHAQVRVGFAEQGVFIVKP
ncbi:MAG: ABC transporter ATP-binding protein [Bosea sp. (in: a-proteobacteria)]